MIKKAVLFLAIVFSIQTFAQTSNVSPYSFFGIGDQLPNKSVSELSMGGIGGAQNSTSSIFYTNPASYSKLRFTIFDISGKEKFISIDDGKDKQGSSSFNLSYLTMGFPLTKKAGMVFGVQPNTKVGYALLNTDNPNYVEGETEYFSGTGSTNRVFLGVGYEFPLDIRVGLEGAYTFGNIKRSILDRIDDLYLATMYRTDSQIEGFNVRLGLQQETKISKKLTLKTGVTFELENELNHSGTQRFFTLINTFDPEIIYVKDILIEEDFNSTITSPLKSTASIGVGNINKWYVGVEYTAQDALSFDNDFLQSSNVQYGKSSNISFGGYYIPKSNSITSYWERVAYRTGFYSKNTGLKIKDANGNFQDIKDFGISFGVTLPSKRKLTNVNIGFDIGKRGNVDANLIKENYFNFRVGFSFVDKWFNKRKLN